MKIYEHKGRFYRRLGEDEVIHETDFLSIEENQVGFMSTGRAGETPRQVRDGNSRQPGLGYASYYREVEPLVAAMIKAKENSE